MPGEQWSACSARLAVEDEVTKRLTIKLVGSSEDRVAGVMLEKGTRGCRALVSVFVGCVEFRYETARHVAEYDALASVAAWLRSRFRVSATCLVTTGVAMVRVTRKSGAAPVAVDDPALVPVLREYRMAHAA
jgi:hypothetical protein